MADKKKAAAPKPVVRVVDPAEREKVLKSAMAQLEKKFGEGTVMFMGENRHMDIECISTAGPGAGYRRTSARTYHRNIRY